MQNSQRILCAILGYILSCGFSFAQEVATGGGAVRLGVTKYLTAFLISRRNREILSPELISSGLDC